MSGILKAGVLVVNLALVSYTIGIINEQRRRRITSWVLAFLTAGVVFDIVATSFMVVASSGPIFSLHGILGFSALAAMLLETTFAWRHRRHSGTDTVPRWLHTYSRLAYGWWIVAYITGALLVAAGRA